MPLSGNPRSSHAGWNARQIENSGAGVITMNLPGGMKSVIPANRYSQLRRIGPWPESAQLSMSWPSLQKLLGHLPCAGYVFRLRAEMRDLPSKACVRETGDWGLNGWFVGVSHVRADNR